MTSIMPRKPREGGKVKPKMKGDNNTESSSSSSSPTSSNDCENVDGPLEAVSCGDGDTKLSIASSSVVAVKKVKGRPKVEKGVSDQGTPEEWMHPIEKDGETVLEVECGTNKAHLYLSKLCQGSKGSCIEYDGSWLTPNEFQFICGRESAKDWKRSIRHREKSLKLLVAKGIITIHPKSCDCDGCRVSKKVNKCRLADKRRESFGDAAAVKPVSVCTAQVAAVTGNDSDDNTLDNMDDVTPVQTDDATKDSSITGQSCNDEPLTSSLSPNLNVATTNSEHGADGDRSAPVAIAEDTAISANDRNLDYELAEQSSTTTDAVTTEPCSYIPGRADAICKETVDESKLEPKSFHDTVTDDVGRVDVSHMDQVTANEGKLVVEDACADDQDSRVNQNVLVMDKPELFDESQTAAMIQSPQPEQHSQQRSSSNNTGQNKDGCTAQSGEQGVIHVETVRNLVSRSCADVASTNCGVTGLIPVLSENNDEQRDISISYETEQITVLSENTSNDVSNANSSDDTKCNVNGSPVTKSNEPDDRCTLGSEDEHPLMENDEQMVRPPEDKAPEDQATLSCQLSHRQNVHIEDAQTEAQPDTCRAVLSPTKQANSVYIADTHEEHMHDLDVSCKHDEQQRHRKKDDHDRRHQYKHNETADHPRKQEEVTQHQQHVAAPIEPPTPPHKNKEHTSHHHHHRKQREWPAQEGNKQTVATVRPQKVEPVNSGHPSINKTIPVPSIASTYPHYSPFPYPTQGQLPMGISWPFPISSSIPEQLHLNSRATSSTEYMRLLAASHYHMHSSNQTPDLPGALSHYAINSRLHPGLPYTYPSIPFYPPHMTMKDVNSFLPTMASAPTMPPSFIPSPLSPHLPPMFGTLPSAHFLDYAKLHNLASVATSRSSDSIVNTVTGHTLSPHDSESQHRKRKSTDGHELEPALDLSTAKKYKPGEYHGMFNSEHHAQKSPSSNALHHGLYQEHKIKQLQSFTGHPDASPSHIQSANMSGARSSTECICGRVRPITDWTVEEVCDFLRALEGCFPYSERFREQGVDGRILSILTLDQLTHILGMKLGPAVLLTETVLKFLHSAARQGCERCMGTSHSVASAPTFTPMRRPEGILVHAS